MVTLRRRNSGTVGICSFDYKEVNGIRGDQGGEGPFDLLVHGVTAIGKALNSRSREERRYQVE